MFKILLGSAMAVTLLSGVSFADSSTTKSLNLGPIGMSTTVEHDNDARGSVVEREKTVRHDADPGMMGESTTIHKDKTVTRSSELAPADRETHEHSETTTIR